MDDKLLNLPFYIQLSLGSGYLAYLIAYAGIRQHHTPSEVIFRSLSFGMAATVIMLWAPEAPQLFNSWKHDFWRPFSAFAFTVGLGAFWRWRGMRWSRAILRNFNVSWTDDIPTAWLSITATETSVTPGQIIVDLDNGRTLMCDDTRDFIGAPFAPCVYGLDGSIAFYVTDEKPPGGDWIKHADVRHLDGDLLTYLPASVVKRVELRLTPSSTRRPSWWRRWRWPWRWGRRDTRLN